MKHDISQNYALSIIYNFISIDKCFKNRLQLKIYSDTIPHVVRPMGVSLHVEGGVKPWQSVIFVISQFTSEIR